MALAVMPNRQEATWQYGEKLASHADRIASMVDGSDAAYYESGYLLVYATFRSYRAALNLEPGQTTTVLYTTQLSLGTALVGERIGVPGRTWLTLPFDNQKNLSAIVTEHLLALHRRQGWYDQFAWAGEEFGPGDLLWEFTEQVGRSTGHQFTDELRERVRMWAMVALSDLDPPTFIDQVRGVTE